MNGEMTMGEVWVMEWEESERGWGTRPDGVSLHKSKADCDAYVKKYWEGMPDRAPDEYSRPCWTAPRQAKVEPEVADWVSAMDLRLWHGQTKFDGDILKIELDAETRARVEQRVLEAVTSHGVNRRPSPL